MPDSTAFDLPKAALSSGPPVDLFATKNGSQKPASVFDQALKQYPIIQKTGTVGVVTPRENAGYLEFYPPGETGTKESPRPQTLPLDKPGVEIYSGKTTPLDVLGDVTSHYLVHTDPVVKQYYQNFVQSLNPQQQQLLQQQYQYAQKNEGETRPFQQWLEIAGLPGYFRGYPFKQWPEDFNKQAYTPEQRAMLDGMMKYLSGEQPK